MFGTADVCALVAWATAESDDAPVMFATTGRAYMLRLAATVATIEGAHLQPLAEHVATTGTALLLQMIGGVTT